MEQATLGLYEMAEAVCVTPTSCSEVEKSIIMKNRDNFAQTKVRRDKIVESGEKLKLN